MAENNSGRMTVGVLGVCPLLAKSTTLITAGTMGAAFFCILLMSVVSLSCCRRYIPFGFRLPAILIISVTWVIVLDLLMQAWWYDMRQILGVYLPLLAMNSFIMLSLEKTALTSPPIKALKTILQPGLVILLGVCLLGAARELLGQGSVLSDVSLFPGEVYGPWSFTDTGYSLLSKAPGALLGLGLLIAAGRHFIAGKNLDIVDQSLL